jgi:glycosyltransferase involved in cell wall biosynthesis
VSNVSADPSSGLTSIIVPCWNQRGFTEICFQALLRHTRPAWELIVVDNGSTDDTAAYLAGVRDAAPVPVTIIANRENLGFPRAINQGLEAASGEYLVLLNNDAVVTDGWLDQLIALTRVEMGGVGGGPAAIEASRETCGRAEGGVGRPAPNNAGNGGSAGWSSGFEAINDSLAHAPEAGENSPPQPPLRKHWSLQKIVGVLE